MEVLYAPKISKNVDIEFDSWVKVVGKMQVLWSECQFRLKFKPKMRRFLELLFQMPGTVKFYLTTI